MSFTGDFLYQNHGLDAGNHLFMQILFEKVCLFGKKSYLCSDKSHHTSRPQGQCTRVGLRFFRHLGYEIY